MRKESDKMEENTPRFTYETPELASFSWSELRTVTGAGDSDCTDELQELDGNDFGFGD